MAQSNTDLVRTLWALYDRGADEAWPPPADEFDRRIRTELYDEHVVIRNADEFPIADEYRGHEGLRQWSTDVWEVFSEVRNEVEELIEFPGDIIVSVQKTHLRMRHTGIETRLRWATVWWLQAGKVMRAAGYVTKAEALEAAQRPSSSS